MIKKSVGSLLIILSFAVFCSAKKKPEHFEFGKISLATTVDDLKRTYPTSKQDYFTPPSDQFHGDSAYGVDVSSTELKNGIYEVQLIMKSGRAVRSLMRLGGAVHRISTADDYFNVVAANHYPECNDIRDELIRSYGNPVRVDMNEWFNATERMILVCRGPDKDGKNYALELWIHRTK